MNINITIQKATSKDAQEIGEVFYRTWLATYPNEEIGVTVDDVEFKFKDRKDRDGSKFDNLPENEIFLTAKDGDHVVGVCDVIKHEDKNELKAIYVLPEYQGRGIGRMFWNEALKFFDSKKDIKVEVVTYNTNAVKFYKKLGFQDTGKRFHVERLRMKSGVILPEMEMEIVAGVR